MTERVAPWRDELSQTLGQLNTAVDTAHLTPDGALRVNAFLASITRQLYDGGTPAGFTRPDGTLLLARWAEAVEQRGRQVLAVDSGERSRAMVGSKATGDPLVSNGHLGVDVIRVPAGSGFPPHTHVGDHLLIVVAGTGTVAYEGRIYETAPGQVYLIEGSKPHAVGAITDHVILAVGAPHRAVDAIDRQSVVAYQAIAAELGDLECQVCGVRATVPQTLRELGCPHCPSRF
jgi:quercetin dioxygenase-like cupin family protein